MFSFVGVEAECWSILWFGLLRDERGGKDDIAWDKI